MHTWLVASLGAGIGLGLFLIGFGLSRATGRQHSGADQLPPQFTWWLWRSRLKVGWPKVALAFGAVTAGWWVWQVTGWPVAGAGTALVVWWSRAIFGGDAAGKAARDRVEAVAAWVESVRGTVDAGAGLGQALVTVGRVATPGLETETQTLADRIHAGDRVDDALRGFAREVDDRTCDEAVVALIGAHRRSGNLTALLDQLARSARDNAAMRGRIITTRVRVHTAKRLIGVCGLGLMVFVIASGADFLTFYNGPLGQMALAIVVGLGGMVMYWLVRMSRWHEPARLIDVEASAR